MALFDDIGKKLSRTGQDAVKKAKDLADTAKLSGQISEKEREVLGSMQRLGERYYALHGTAPEPELAAFCREIAEGRAAIAALREEVRRVKNIKICTGCGAENDYHLNYCGTCGTALPEREEPQAKLQQCSACGSAVTEDALYCTTCGERLQS